MLRTLLILGGGLLYWVAIPVAAFQQEGDSNQLKLDPDVFIELKTKAIPAWGEIEQTLHSVSVIARKTVSERIKGELIAPARTPTYNLAWDHAQGLALLQAEYDAHSDRSYYSVANPDYSFEVWADEKLGQDQLQGARKAPWDSANPRGTLPRGFVEHEFTAHTAARFLSLPLRLLIDSPEFESIEAVGIRENGKRLIRYSARYLGDEGESRQKGGTYTIVIDPVMNYRLLRGQVSGPDNPTEQTIEVQYHDSANVFVPKFVDVVRRNQQEQYTAEWRTEFELPRQFDLPEKQFYLPFYGFDESMLEPISPNRWLRWLLVAVGSMSLIIAYWLLARNSRQSKV